MMTRHLIRKRLLPILSAGLAILTVAAVAKAQEAPDTRIVQPLVSSTVIVDGKVQENGVVPAEQSGLTVDPVLERDAEQIRRDAEEALSRKQLTNIVATSQPDVTVVSVDQVVVERPNSRDSEACVTIGKIASRKGCRPIRK